MQNHRLSVESLGYCASSGLHLDPATLLEGMTIIGVADKAGGYVRQGRLFWLVYILNTQV